MLKLNIIFNLTFLSLVPYIKFTELTLSYFAICQEESRDSS